jgi:Uma2 family endonuclease
MSTLPQESDFAAGYSPIIVHLQPVLHLSDDQLYDFARINRELRIERNAQGELLLMPPTGGDTGECNAEITIQLGVWAKGDGTGATFDSSTGFRLSNGAVRSPDASWISYARLALLSAEQRGKFIPLSPDFVIELRSSTDSLRDLQAKMQEYIDNGTQLGLLIDRVRKRVYVYQPNTPVQVIDDPDTIPGTPVLSGFALALREIW